MSKIARHAITAVVRPSLAALAGTTLLLAACGGDDDPMDDALDDVPADVADQLEDLDSAETTGPADGTDDAGTERDLQPLRILLPEPSEPPAGWEHVAALCDPATEDGGVWFPFAVPAEWEATGRSFGGSGSPLADSVELTFDTGAGDVTVGTEPDSRHPDGTILDSGQPWESFDYEYRVGDDVTEITFDDAGSVTLGDQDIEVVVAEQSQAPDVLGTTEHKARLEVAELPNPAVGDDDGITPASMVVTVTHDAEEVDLTDEQVLDVVGSFVAPECTIEEIVMSREVLLGEDVDGDGEVTTAEDLLGG